MAIEILSRRGSSTAARALLTEELGEKAKVGLLKIETDRMIESRSRQHKKWPDYGRLYRGDHFPLPPIGVDSQVVLNIISKLVRQLTALVTMGNVRGEVISNSPVAEGGARTMDARLKDIQEKNRVGFVQDLLMTDACVYGTGATYTWWDAEARNGRGEVRIDWLDIYNLFVDRLATGVRDAQVLAVRKIMPVSMAEAMWPEFHGRIVGEKLGVDENNYSGLYRPIEDVPNTKPWQLMTALSGNNTAGTSQFTSYVNPSSNASPFDDAHIWEYYIRATYADAMYEPEILRARGDDQRAQAEDENARLAEGTWVEVESGQDHGTHYELHRKSFLELSRADNVPQELMALLAEHMKLHRAWMKDPAYRKFRMSKYPGGWRMIQRCGDNILYDGKVPIGRLPIGVMKNYEDPGYFWGLSECSDQESLQHAVDVLLSQCLDLVRFGAHRPCVVDEASNIKDDQLVAQIGAILRAQRQPGVPVIEYPLAPQFDPSWLNFLAFMINGMQEQAGLAKVMEGNLPGSGLSGEALESLRRGGQVRVTLRANNFQQAWVDTCSAAIATAYVNETEPVVVKVQGDPRRLPQGAQPANDGQGSYFVQLNQPDGTNSLQAFALDSFDVFVNASGTPAQGKSARRDELIFLQEKMVTNPIFTREQLVPIGTLTQANVQRLAELDAQNSGPPPVPPPSVNINLRGELHPQQAMAIAAGQAPDEAMSMPGPTSDSGMIPQSPESPQGPPSAPEGPPM